MKTNGSVERQRGRQLWEKHKRHPWKRVVAVLLAAVLTFIDSGVSVYAAENDEILSFVEAFEEAVTPPEPVSAAAGATTMDASGTSTSSVTDAGGTTTDAGSSTNEDADPEPVEGHADTPDEVSDDTTLNAGTDSTNLTPENELGGGRGI